MIKYDRTFWRFPYKFCIKEYSNGRFIFSEVKFLGLFSVAWDIRPFWYYEEMGVRK